MKTRKKLVLLVTLILPVLIGGFILFLLFFIIAHANGVTPEEMVSSNPYLNQPDTYFGSPEFLSIEELGISPGDFLFPIIDDHRISSPYGWRIHPKLGNRRFHQGVDIAAPKNTPVYAAASGTVTFAGYRGNYGNLIIIQHEDDLDGFETYYAHLNSISIRKGEKVMVGQSIGRIGSTGLSTGPHLHLEIRFDNNTLDPMKLLKK